MTASTKAGSRIQRAGRIAPHDGRLLRAPHDGVTVMGAFDPGNGRGLQVRSAGRSIDAQKRCHFLVKQSRSWLKVLSTGMTRR
jgi:hypothetical protein